jgi:hypothetical protein
MSIVKLLIFICIVLILIYIALAIYNRYKPVRHSFDIKSGSLNTENIVLSRDASKDFFSKSGATLGFYVKLEDGDKTISIQNQRTSNVLFKIDKALILTVGNGLNDNTECKLYVQTHKNRVEIIDLKPIPRQKWVHIAILRDGRRFDILYSGKIIASKRLDAVPQYYSNPLIFGSPTDGTRRSKINGKFVAGFLEPRRFTIQEVRNEIESTSNTRGEPYMLHSIKSDILSYFSLCPGILCSSRKPLGDSSVEYILEYA